MSLQGHPAFLVAITVPRAGQRMQRLKGAPPALRGLWTLSQCTHASREQAEIYWRALTEQSVLICFAKFTPVAAGGWEESVY